MAFFIYKTNMTPYLTCPGHVHYIINPIQYGLF